MKEITDLKTIQDIELKALQFIDSVCKKHKLRYFLAGGTLLGAVRHKGFIPWDNDVDIAMPRKDYEEFIRIIEQEYTDTPYRIARIRERNNYIYPFAKLYDDRTLMREEKYENPIEWLGIYIDLFPIDVMGDDMETAIHRFRAINRKLARYAACYTPLPHASLSQRCIRLYQRIKYTILGRERCMNRLSKQLAALDYNQAVYIASTCGLRKEKEIMEQRFFSTSVDLDFEGLRLPAPIGWHEYLQAMYGDYMQLPPESARVAPHDVTVLIKNGE